MSFRSPRAWALVFAVLTGLGLVSASRMLLVYRAGGFELGVLDAVLSGLLDWYLWAPLVPAIVACARRFRFERGGRARAIVVHHGAALAFALAQALLFAAASDSVRGAGLARGFQNAIALKLHASAMVYWIVVLALMVERANRRARDRELDRARLDRELADSRLAALQAHLRPHFLFNALNSIAALMRSDADRAERMVARLGELLRRSLAHGAAPEVPLADELAIVDGYLEIERARFGERLAVELAIDPGAERGLVPALLLQPLVENAVRHGAAERVEGGLVHLTVLRHDGRLLLRVEDDGPGVADDRPFERGLGLSSARERLRLLYGEAQSFTLREREGGGTRVEVALPWRESA